MSETMININNLTFGYEENRPVLEQISFGVRKGETIGLVGANGAGKSTLLKLLVGLHLNYRGTVEVDGIPVEKKTLSDIRQKIGYVFQDSDSQLFMSTAYEDIAFGPRNYGLNEKEVDEKVTQALKLVHIEYLKDRPIYQMSGGEKKLVSIATILSMTPDIILMDEPSIALDPKNRRNLIHILNSFPQSKIIASHDLDFIMDTCERTILISDGKIICDGKTEDVLTNKGLLEEHNLELPLSLYGK